MSWDPLSSQYYLTYTAWASPAAGWTVKAAVNKDPTSTTGWRRLGNIFPNMSKHEYGYVKCGALLAMPEGHVPQYYLFSGDVTAQGVYTSSSGSLAGPWSERRQVMAPRANGWDANAGCFTPPVSLCIQLG